MLVVVISPLRSWLLLLSFLRLLKPRLLYWFATAQSSPSKLQNLHAVNVIENTVCELWSLSDGRLLVVAAESDSLAIGVVHGSFL